MKKIPILIDLYVSLAKIGSVTFGGGMAMMPILQRELIEKKKLFFVRLIITNSQIIIDNIRP